MNFPFPLLIGAALAETVVYFAAPKIYSLAARFPLGAPRRMIVRPPALEALRGPPTAGGYRESAVGALDMGRLELPDRLEVDDLVLHFDVGRGFAVARMPYSFSRRILGLARVDVVPVDGALELRPRFIMLGWPSLFTLAPIAALFIAVTEDVSKWPGAFVIGALFIGINVVFGLPGGRARLEAGVVEIERQIQAALSSAEAEARGATG